MIRIITFLIIITILLSCQYRKNYYDCNSLNIEVNKEFELGKPILNVKSKYLLTELLEYQIWMKYKIIMVRNLSLTNHDSCYFKLMNEKIIKHYGYNIDSILLEIDSLLKVNVNKIIYFDGAYSSALSITGKSNKNASLVQNDSIYKEVKDSVSDLLRNKSTFTSIDFWVEINKKGEVERIDFIGNLNNTISNEIFIIYNRLKWYPASVDGKKVSYRFKENIYPD